ncbi:MAG: TIGR00730 family Rossman fold protein [Acidiferrobacteraceae bacterium]|nr:TIGR00730 family Rossman fold protein [Acidiferrobacteraceae bacterium]
MNPTEPPKKDQFEPTTEAMLSRESWRIFQIMAEFVRGFELMANVRPSVSVFGSSRLNEKSRWYPMTVEISRQLSDAGFSIVSGGGPGIMEAANRGGQAGASTSVGLNIYLPKEQASNPFQDLSLRFQHFFARKVMFVKYASAYVIMPGGFGTLDELAEILTLIQTGKGRRIPVILVGTEYWQGLIEWMKKTMLAEGAISPEDLDIFKILDDPDEVAATIIACCADTASSTEDALQLDL